MQVCGCACVWARGVSHYPLWRTITPPPSDKQGVRGPDQRRVDAVGRERETVFTFTLFTLLFFCKRHATTRLPGARTHRDGQRCAFSDERRQALRTKKHDRAVKRAGEQKDARQEEKQGKMMEGMITLLPLISG